MRMPASDRGQHVEFNARYTNKPDGVRDFSRPIRQKLFGEAAVDMQYGSTNIKLNIGYEAGPAARRACSSRSSG